MLSVCPSPWRPDPGWLGGYRYGIRSHRADTVVSLTFDDGNADQLAAEQVMKAHGLVGTFFVTTDWVGTPSYLTQQDLQTIAADGNEIGGHTVTHPDLTTVTTAVAAAEICDGRTSSHRWGFDVTSFAYPFAAENPAVEGIVKTCGYSSARNLGDIRSPASCAACPFAETIPPANPYNTAAPDEVDSTWTLQNLQDLITNAETHGGGWVQLTFHHIAVGTDPTLTISPTLFAQFVTWLAARTASGATVVRTVAQALGTSPPPPPPPPNVPPTAQFSSAAQDLAATFDGSSSIDSDGTVASYSWDFGDGSAAGTGPTPAHSYAAAGTYQVTLTVTDNRGATGSVTRPVVVQLLPRAGAVVPVSPARVMDSRINLGATGAVPAQGTVSLQVTGQGGVPASGVSAVVVNVTAVDPTAAGFVTVWPSGTAEAANVEPELPGRAEHPEPGRRPGRRRRKDPAVQRIRRHRAPAGRRHRLHRGRHPDRARCGGVVVPGPDHGHPDQPRRHRPGPGAGHRVPAGHRSGRGPGHRGVRGRRERHRGQPDRPPGSSRCGPRAPPGSRRRT